MTCPPTCSTSPTAGSRTCRPSSGWTGSPSSSRPAAARGRSPASTRSPGHRAEACAVSPDRASWPTRAYAAVERAIAAQRRHRPWFDHLARAGGRYQRTQGDLMAAGVTYFAFLGLFPVLLLVASVIGLVLSGNELLQEELFDAIRDAVPGAVGEELVRQLDGAIADAGVLGLIGLVGSLYAGLRAMDKLRIGM